MISFKSISFLILFCYSLAALLGIAGLILRAHQIKTISCILTALGFLAQTVSLIMGIHGTLTQGLSAGAYLQLIAWFLVLCSLGSWYKFRESTPILFASPLALILFCMSLPYLHSPIILSEKLTPSFYVLHMGALFLSLAILAVAFCTALLFLILEKRIKSKTRMEGFLNDMPALSILDKTNSIAVIVGFPLYTLGIVTGLLWARPVFGTAVSGDPKEVISLFVWGLFAFLFYVRLVKGWRGRKPALLLTGIFLLSVFSIIFVNALFVTHHAFVR